MGGAISKTWNEMNEVNEAGADKKDKEEKDTTRAGKTKLRDRLRSRILRADPRSASEEVARTPIAVAREGEGDTPIKGAEDTPLKGEGDTPLKTLVQDPRSPGMTGLDRTPIVVVAGKEDTRTPLRGAIPPNFELPPNTPQDDSTADMGDPRSPLTLEQPRTPLGSSTPTTIPLGTKDQSQPSNILADRLRGEALAALRDHQTQVSTETAPSAESTDGHNDSSLII